MFSNYVNTYFHCLLFFKHEIVIFSKKRGFHAQKTKQEGWKISEKHVDSETRLQDTRLVMLSERAYDTALVIGTLRRERWRDL
jgi:hypothetical protein